jgi:hypothetical protein
MQARPTPPTPSPAPSAATSASRWAATSSTAPMRSSPRRTRLASGSPRVRLSPLLACLCFPASASLPAFSCLWLPKIVADASHCASRPFRFEPCGCTADVGTCICFRTLCIGCAEALMCLWQHCRCDKLGMRLRAKQCLCVQVWWTTVHTWLHGSTNKPCVTMSMPSLAIAQRQDTVHVGSAASAHGFTLAPSPSAICAQHRQWLARSSCFSLSKKHSKDGHSVGAFAAQQPSHPRAQQWHAALNLTCLHPPKLTW